MTTIEKLGQFYLGKLLGSKQKDAVLLYDSKDLTTHAVILGMTGSGKTGLGIALLEEAAIDKIPSIVIDPKGDLGNLLLSFPNLSPDEFYPWIDKSEAERNGMDLKTYAEKIAKTWKDGLKDWGEGADRIQKFNQSVEKVIYTPANTSGIPLSILNSFSAPPKELRQDPGAMRDRILSTTSSILGLLGIEADPLVSREHILISNLFDKAWSAGDDLDLPKLIQQIQKPPINKIGVLDIDTFFPPKDRMALSIRLNNLLAAPGFQAWMTGEPLDIQNLLFTKEGKPKISVISIGHLSDAERMFFVTLLLNEFIAWMRRQAGTSSLRAMLYMDEIFGYFPPTSMPPSKTPMLTLLKQARAFGVGVILSTQNPVDLDYKGLSNCGTWFIGKLQTDRDKSRVLEGLAAASNGEMDASSLDKMIASTGKRAFILRSIYEKEPLLFQTRWTLSYLAGPLTLAQISKLTPDKEKLPDYVETKSKQPSTQVKPLVPEGISEFYLNTSNAPTPHFKAQILGFAKIHYVSPSDKVDTWKEVQVIAPYSDQENGVLWDQGKIMEDVKSKLATSPSPESTFEDIPKGLLQPKTYTQLQKGLSDWLYQTQSLPLFSAEDLNLASNNNESESEFKSRIDLVLREKRDEIVKNLRDKYASKLASLEQKIRQAQENLQTKQEKAGSQKTDTWISIGTTLLGAVLGKGVTKGTISQAGSSIKKMGKISKDDQSVSNAEENLKAYQAQKDEIQKNLDDEIAKVDQSSSNVTTKNIKPKKGDIKVDKIALIWTA